MNKILSKSICFILCFLLLFQHSGFAQAAFELNLASHLQGTRAPIVEAYRPLHLRSLGFTPSSQEFNLLLDKGSSTTSDLATETEKLMEFFLVGVSLPNASFWVNLRPDSPDEVIDPYVEQTEVGRILLEADVRLKKDTALATSPATPEGKEYWKRLYQKAEELFGSTESIQIPTLVRPWILPNEIIIREAAGEAGSTERNQSAYIYKATLKVMLEEDYLQGAGNGVQGTAGYTFKDPRLKALNEYAASLMRELVIPGLSKRVNTAKEYASLRQIYYSLTLSQWFKSRFAGKGGVYSSRIDSSDLTGITSATPWSKKSYFTEYQDSFSKGEYQIKEQVATSFGSSMRTYVSGGIMLTMGEGSFPEATRGKLTGSSSSPIKVLGGNPERRVRTPELIAAHTIRGKVEVEEETKVSSPVKPQLFKNEQAAETYRASLRETNEWLAEAPDRYDVNWLYSLRVRTELGITKDEAALQRLGYPASLRNLETEDVLAAIDSHLALGISSEKLATRDKLTTEERSIPLFSGRDGFLERTAPHPSIGIDVIVEMWLFSGANPYQFIAPAIREYDEKTGQQKRRFILREIRNESSYTDIFNAYFIEDNVYLGGEVRETICGLGHILSPVSFIDRPGILRRIREKAARFVEEKARQRGYPWLAALKKAIDEFPEDKMLEIWPKDYAVVPSRIDLYLEGLKILGREITKALDKYQEEIEPASVQKNQPFSFRDIIRRIPFLGKSSSPIAVKPTSALSKIQNAETTSSPVAVTHPFLFEIRAVGNRAAAAEMRYTESLLGEIAANREYNRVVAESEILYETDLGSRLMAAMLPETPGSDTATLLKNALPYIQFIISSRREWSWFGSPLRSRYQALERISKQLQRAIPLREEQRTKLIAELRGHLESLSLEERNELARKLVRRAVLNLQHRITYNTETESRFASLGPFTLRFVFNAPLPVHLDAEQQAIEVNLALFLDEFNTSLFEYALQHALRRSRLREMTAELSAQSGLNLPEDILADITLIILEDDDVNMRWTLGDRNKGKKIAHDTQKRYRAQLQRLGAPDYAELIGRLANIKDFDAKVEAIHRYLMETAALRQRYGTTADDLSLAAIQQFMRENIEAMRRMRYERRAAPARTTTTQATGVPLADDVWPPAEYRTPSATPSPADTQRLTDSSAKEGTPSPWEVKEFYTPRPSFLRRALIVLAAIGASVIAIGRWGPSLLPSRPSEAEKPRQTLEYVYRDTPAAPSPEPHQAGFERMENMQPFAAVCLRPVQANFTSGFSVAGRGNGPVPVLFQVAGTGADQFFVTGFSRNPALTDETAEPTVLVIPLGAPSQETVTITAMIRGMQKGERIRVPMLLNGELEGQRNGQGQLELAGGALLLDSDGDLTAQADTSTATIRYTLRLRTGFTIVSVESNAAVMRQRASEQVGKLPIEIQQLLDNARDKSPQERLEAVSDVLKRFFAYSTKKQVRLDRGEWGSFFNRIIADQSLSWKDKFVSDCDVLSLAAEVFLRHLGFTTVMPIGFYNDSDSVITPEEAHARLLVEVNGQWVIFEPTRYTERAPEPEPAASEQTQKPAEKQPVETPQPQPAPAPPRTTPAGERPEEKPGVAVTTLPSSAHNPKEFEPRPEPYVIVYHYRNGGRRTLVSFTESVEGTTIGELLDALFSPIAKKETIVQDFTPYLLPPKFIPLPWPVTVDEQTIAIAVRIIVNGREIAPFNPNTIERDVKRTRERKLLRGDKVEIRLLFIRSASSPLQRSELSASILTNDGASSPVMSGWSGRLLSLLTAGFLLLQTGDRVRKEDKLSQENVTVATQGNRDAVESLSVLASEGSRPALHTLVTLATQGNRDAVLSLGALANQGNSETKEALRTLDTTGIVQLASQGDREAVAILSVLVNHGNSEAKEALRTLDTTGIVQLASQGNRDAVLSLYTLASRGNRPALNTLISLASQGNPDAVLSLYILASRGNDEAYEALRTLDISKIVQLASQGNRNAVESLEYLADQGNSEAKEALQTLDTTRIVQLASQGNRDAVLSLQYLALKGNRPALNTLITLASQGNRNAVLSLGALAKQGNSETKEALRTLDTTGIVQLASQGDRDAVKSLGYIAAYNPKALDILFEMVTTHKAILDTVEDVLKNAVCLPIVRQINDLHNSQDNIRFSLVSTAHASRLYALMVYGQEEIYTSSFNGLFNRLLERMQKEGLSGEQLLTKVNYNKFRIFIKLCASFNRLNEFLGTVNTPEARKQLIQSFVKDLDKAKDPLEEAVVVADMFGVIQDKNILAILQETVRSEYERVVREDKKETKTLYGLLAGMFSQKAVINVEWLQEMSRKYQLANILEIPQSALVDARGRHTGQYFFYNDEDGEASFRSFISAFHRGNWRLEDAPHYISFQSTSGASVTIYANKPKFAEEGQKEIGRLFKERNLKPQMIVHRGHSYHVDKTIETINPNARLVYLGSCGGYNNVKAVLDRSSDAHIFSTKGMGTMVINDPLLRAIAEHIRQGHGINWPRFKKEAETALGSNGTFHDYIFPHENLGVMFLKAYNRVLKQGSTPRPAASSPAQEPTSASSRPSPQGEGVLSASEGPAAQASPSTDSGLAVSEGRTASSPDEQSLIKGISLPIDVPLPIHPPQFLKDKIRAWITEEQNFTIKAIKEKIIANIQHITFNEFMQALYEVVDKINPLLVNKPFAILWDSPGRSKRWVYELAKNKLVRKPSEGLYFRYEGGETLQRLVDAGIDTFLVIDDASYNGIQIAMEILNVAAKHFRNLENQDGSSTKRPHFIIATPYMTAYARDLFNSYKNSSNINITVFSTHTIPTIRDILTEEEINAISSRPKLSSYDYLDSIFPNHALTYFDHMVPDEATAGPLRDFFDPGSLNRPYDEPATPYYEQEEADFVRQRQQGNRQGASIKASSPLEEIVLDDGDRAAITGLRDLLANLYQALEAWAKDTQNQPKRAAMDKAAESLLEVLRPSESAEQPGHLPPLYQAFTMKDFEARTNLDFPNILPVVTASSDTPSAESIQAVSVGVKVGLDIIDKVLAEGKMPVKIHPAYRDSKPEILLLLDDAVKILDVAAVERSIRAASSPAGGSSADKLSTIMDKHGFTPETLVETLSETFPEMKQAYQQGVSVWEGYTLREHTLMVLRQFEKYFAGVQLPASINPNIFRLILALHDTGKPTAVRQGNKRLHQQLTGELIQKLNSRLPMDDRQLLLALALTSADPIGSYILFGNLRGALEEVEKMAQIAGLTLSQFFDLLTIYYQVDAGSYTADAGGRPSLEYLFEYDTAKKKFVFDTERQRLKFSAQVTERFDIFEQAIKNRSASSTQETPGAADASTEFTSSGVEGVESASSSATKTLADEPANASVAGSPAQVWSEAQRHDAVGAGQWEEAGYESIDGFLVHKEIPAPVRIHIINLLSSEGFRGTLKRYGILIFDVTAALRGNELMIIAPRTWVNSSVKYGIHIRDSLPEGANADDFYSASNITVDLLHEVGHRVWQDLSEDERTKFRRLFDAAPAFGKANHGDIAEESFANWLAYLGSDLKSFIPPNCLAYIRSICAKSGISLISASSPLGTRLEYTSAEQGYELFAGLDAMKKTIEQARREDPRRPIVLLVDGGGKPGKSTLAHAIDTEKKGGVEYEDGLRLYGEQYQNLGISDLAQNVLVIRGDSIHDYFNRRVNNQEISLSYPPFHLKVLIEDTAWFTNTPRDKQHFINYLPHYLKRAIAAMEQEPGRGAIDRIIVYEQAASLNYFQTGVERWDTAHDFADIDDAVIIGATLAKGDADARTIRLWAGLWHTKQQAASPAVSADDPMQPAASSPVSRDPFFNSPERMTAFGFRKAGWGEFVLPLPGYTLHIPRSGDPFVVQTKTSQSKKASFLYSPERQELLVRIPELSQTYHVGKPFVFEQYDHMIKSFEALGYPVKEMADTPTEGFRRYDIPLEKGVLHVAVVKGAENAYLFSHLKSQSGSVSTLALSRARVLPETITLYPENNAPPIEIPYAAVDLNGLPGIRLDFLKARDKQNDIGLWPLYQRAERTTQRDVGRLRVQLGLTETDFADAKKHPDLILPGMARFIRETATMLRREFERLYQEALKEKGIPQQRAAALAREIADTAFPVTKNNSFPSKERSSSPVGSEGRSSGQEPIPTIDAEPNSEVIANKGGIDLRSLPIDTQRALSLLASDATVQRSGAHWPIQSGQVQRTLSLPELGVSWQEIQHMLSSGITPSTERLKEYAAGCIQSAGWEGEIEKVLGAIADILRREEECCRQTDKELAELLAALETV